MNNRQRKCGGVRYIKNRDMATIRKNKYLNRKEGWLSKKSNEIQSICALISVLIIGVLGLMVSYQQTDLSNQNNILYEKEISPHFRINELSVKNSDESFFEEVIQIKNHGGNYYMFRADVFSFIIFYQGGNAYAIPMKDYYCFSFAKSSNVDNVIEEHFTEYRSKIHDLILEANKCLRENDDRYLNGTYGHVVNYVRINYQNVLGEEKTQYFEAENSKLIDNDIGDKYYDLCSLKYYNDEGIGFSVIGMDVETMLEFATTDLKNLYIIDME